MSDKPRPWDYNVEKMERRLNALKERYFRPVIAHPDGHLCHHGDCETHRAMDIYKYAPCTCGLLHDLRMVSYDIAIKIFPKLQDDQAKQDAMIPGHRYWRGPISEEERAKCDEFLKKHFGEAIGPSPEEWKELTERDWTVIEKVFGKSFRDRMEVEWQTLDETD